MQELTASKHDLQSMLRRFSGLEFVPTAITVFGPDRRIWVWNAAAEELYGWRADEVFAQVITTVPSSRREEYEALSARVRAGEVVRDFDAVRLRRDGSEVIVSMTMRPVLDEEGGTWVVVSALDVTERRRLQAGLRQGRQRYRRVADALRLAEQQRESLVRMLVHDFKSPISVTTAALRFLCGVDASEIDSREAIEDALTSVESLHDMTLDLLDISRSEDGNLRANRSATDVCSVIRGVLAGGSRFEKTPTEFHADKPVTAHVDPSLMRRIVRNLVDNARKYGGSSPVLLTCDSSGGVLRITVADHGPGIAASFRERIFDKYYRINSDVPQKDARPSHGLGLTFCKLGVEAHGGTIRVLPNDPTGCVFVIEIPDV
jgi:PAS domain S-box-containing protein